MQRFLIGCSGMIVLGVGVWLNQHQGILFGSAAFGWVGCYLASRAARPMAATAS